MSDDESLPEPQLDCGYDRVVVVDNVPVVPVEKHEKLVGFLTKIFTVVGPLAEGGVTMPLEGNSNKGFLFLEYTNAEHAKEAVRRLNNHGFDKSHILRVTMLNDMDRVMATSDTYQEPTVAEYREVPNLQLWLHDERAREMFLVRHGDESEVFWHDSQQKPQKCYARRQWTEFGHQFSPHGSFVATFHRAGIALWGGPRFTPETKPSGEDDWVRLNRYPHNLVKYVDFSPSENYLVTMSDQEVGPTGRPIASSQEHSVIIWHILSGKNTREFKIEGPKSQHGWPVFKWSHNDKYFARIQDDAIYVRETPSMLLLDKKSISLPGVKEICWSPTQNLLAAYIPEQKETPAKVCIIELPSRRELRQKNLFNVSDVKMHWQSNGDYLCVKVDRHSKSKKTTFTNFELFRIKEKEIPIEVLEIKEQIIAFAWEPKGHRFIVAHGEPPRVDVSFYSMKPNANKQDDDANKKDKKDKKGGKKAAAAAAKAQEFSVTVANPERVTLLRTLEKVPVNHIFWSPAGNTCVLGGLKTLNGKLMFYNVNDFELMAEEEHFMCTDVEWDPSGRYVTTFVSAWRQAMENGYCVWSFSGKLLTKVSVDKFYQFLWRPRPPSLLTDKQEAAIKKNLATLSKKYTEQDSVLKRAEADEQAAGRRKIRVQFEEQQKARLALRASRYANFKDQLPVHHDEEEMMEQTVEEILDVKQELVQ